MAVTTTSPLAVKHEAFRSDDDREHDGFVAELEPDLDREMCLEDLLTTEHGRAEEASMKMLIKGGLI